MYVVINATDAGNADLQHAIVISCNSPYKSCHLQLCIQKYAIAKVHKKLSIALGKPSKKNCDYSDIVLISFYTHPPEEDKDSNYRDKINEISQPPFLLW